MKTSEILNGLTEESAIIEFAKVYEEKNKKANEHGVGHKSLVNMKFRDFIDTLNMIFDYNKSGFDYLRTLDRKEKMELIERVKKQL